MSDQHIRARNIGPTSEIKTDKRDLAGTQRLDTTGGFQEINIARKTGCCRTRVGKQAEQGWCGNQTKPAGKSLPKEVTPGDRPPVIIQPEWFIR